MGAVLNLAGRRFVRLKVTRRAPSCRLQVRARWECDCDCGGKTVVDGTDLIRGKTMSCGCLMSVPLDSHEQTLRADILRMHAARRARKAPIRTQATPRESRDLTGEIFGSLKVRRLDHRDAHRKDYWLCFCDCGRRRIVRGDKLLTGRTRSCGSRGCKRADA